MRCLALLLLLLVPADALAGNWNPDHASNEDVVRHLASLDREKRMDAVKEVKARCLFEADPKLVALARTDPDQKVRLVALKAMIRCKMPSALAAAETAAMSDEDPAVRNKAVRGIEKFGSEASVPVLVRVLQKDPEHGIRQKAATVLRKKRWTGAQAAQTECARSGPAPKLRVECALGLLALDPDVWGALIAERLVDEPDNKGKRRLIDELRARPLPVTRDALVKLLDWGDVKVRIDASLALAELGDPSVAPILRAKASGEYDEGAREKMNEAAARLGG